MSHGEEMYLIVAGLVVFLWISYLLEQIRNLLKDIRNKLDGDIRGTMAEMLEELERRKG